MACLWHGSLCYYVLQNKHIQLSRNDYDIDYADLREYNTELSRIGNNLNQIAKKVNMNGEATPSDIKEAKELMEKIWLTQKSMLSKHPSVQQ